MGGYSRIRASGWASAGVMPRRMFSSAGMTRCDSISCSEWGRRFRLPTPAQHPRSRSSRRTRKNARVRAAIALSPVNMELPRGDPQQTFDHAGNPLQVLSFGDELFTAGLRNGVELGLPVTVEQALPPASARLRAILPHVLSSTLSNFRVGFTSRALSKCM